MRTSLTALAIAAFVATGMSGTAIAQSCPPGYGVQNGVCQPAPANPVSGAAQGAANGAAAGGAAAGPVGAAVGGAVGTATGTVAGTANMLSGGSFPRRPALVQGPCPAGRVFYNGGCYAPH